MRYTLTGMDEKPGRLPSGVVAILVAALSAGTVQFLFEVWPYLKDAVVFLRGAAG